eukprot:388209_1
MDNKNIVPYSQIVDEGNAEFDSNTINNIQTQSSQIEGAPSQIIIPQNNIIVQNISVIGSLNAVLSPPGLNYKQYFKTKLQDHHQTCCPSCCTLWLASHIWLILFTVISIIRMIICAYAIWLYYINIADLQHTTPSWLFYSWIGVFVWEIVYFFINILCFYALRACISSIFLVKIIVLCLDCVTYLGQGGILSLFIMVPLTVWAIYVFYKIRKWAIFFKNGGVYDPNMLTPVYINIA